MSALVGNMPSSRTWIGVAWNGSIFCAIAQSTNISATSSDGINWTARTLPISATWRGIAWNGIVFCAAYNPFGADLAAAFYYSADGINWLASNPAFINFRPREIVAENGTFFCADDYGSSVLTSTDGITFSWNTLPANTFWNKAAWNKAALYCISRESSITNQAAISSDGHTWIATTLPVSGIWTNIAGGNGTICMISTSSGLYFVTSKDGVNWTSGAFSVSIESLIWNGSFFCALPTSGSTIYWSREGLTWTAKSLPISDTWITSTSSSSVTLLLSATKSVIVDNWSYFWTNFKGQTESIA